MKKTKFLILVITLLLFNNAKSAITMCAKNNGTTECVVLDYPSCNDPDFLEDAGTAFPDGWTCGAALKKVKVKFSFIGQLPDGRAFVYDDGEKVKIVSDKLKDYMIQSLKLVKTNKIKKEEVKKEFAKRFINDADAVSMDRLTKLSAELGIPIVKTDEIGKPNAQNTDCPWGYVLENGVCIPKKYGPVISNDHRVFVCHNHNLAIVSYHSNSFGEIVIDDVIDLGTCGSNFIDHMDFSVINGANWTEATEKQYQEINAAVIKNTKVDSAEIISQIKQATNSTTTKSIWYNPAKIKSEVRTALGIDNCPTGFVWENGKCVHELDIPTTPPLNHKTCPKGMVWSEKFQRCRMGPKLIILPKPSFFIFIGGGATLPGKPVKTATALPILGNIDINAYIPLVKKKTWSFGLNAGTAFGLSNKFADDECPDPFQVQNQTGSPTVSAKGSGSPKNAGFKFEAGPALMVMIKDKFGIMPILNVSYRYIAQKSFTCTQTSIVNTITYNWDLLSQTQTKNNVVAFDPKLRLLYMFGRVGIWVEGSYSIGSKMKTVSTIFDPEGDAQPDGTYDLGQMNLPTYNSETKSTNFSAFGVHGGIVIGVGKRGNRDKGKPFKNETISSSNFQTGGNPLFKCRCCNTEFDNAAGLVKHGNDCCPKTTTTSTVGLIKNDPEWDTLIPGGPIFPPSGIRIVEETLNCKCCGKAVSGTFGENINHTKTCCKKKDAALMKTMQEEMIDKHKITSTQNMQGGGNIVLYSCVCCKEAFQTEDELFGHTCAKGCFGTPIRNTGTVKDIELKLLTDGSTTQDGTPIVGTTIHGTITGIKKPVEIKIIQAESGDSGTAITNKKGNFIVTVKKDTTHKIYVDGVEYGKIKIVSKQENDAFKCDCCGGVYGYDNFLTHAKTCCTKATVKSDYTITYVNAQMVELPNGMGVGTQPTSAITVKKENKTIHYTDISSKEVNSITQQPITFLLPSSFTMATNDIKSIGGEQEQSMDWYWKVYKGDNNNIIAVPLSLMLSPKGVDVIGTSMRKKKDGDKAAPVCKFVFRPLAVDISGGLELMEDDWVPVMQYKGCGGNLVHAPKPDTTIYLPATDFPTNIVYTSNGTDTRILTKQASKPTMLNSINFCSKYIEDYGLVVYPIDFEISCNDAGVMLKGLFENSKKINGTPTSSKKHDYVGHVTLMR